MITAELVLVLCQRQPAEDIDLLRRSQGKYSRRQQRLIKHKTVAVPLPTQILVKHHYICTIEILYLKHLQRMHIAVVSTIFYCCYYCPHMFYSITWPKIVVSNDRGLSIMWVCQSTSGKQGACRHHRFLAHHAPDDSLLFYCGRLYSINCYAIV